MKFSRKGKFKNDNENVVNNKINISKIINTIGMTKKISTKYAIHTNKGMVKNDT